MVDCSGRLLTRIGNEVFLSCRNLIAKRPGLEPWAKLGATTECWGLLDETYEWSLLCQPILMAPVSRNAPIGLDEGYGPVW